MKRSILVKICVCACLLAISRAVSAQTESQTPRAVEINGDTVEFSRQTQQVIAKGNVELVYGDTTIYCDEAEFSRETNIAHATGHVLLKSPQGDVSGDQITFNYNTMQGEFFGARLMAYPYFGKGERVDFLEDNSIRVTDGWVTTSDYDKPEFRIQSKRIDVFPGNKLVAKHVTMRLGNLPMMYLPFYKHRLDDVQPKLLLTPGFDSDWGAFLLSQYRFYTGDKVKGILRLDYRELLDLAGGSDIEYKTDDFGEGLLRLYYTKERKITSDRIWQDRPSPTPERERYKIEWRHKWIVDETTTAIWQYYRLSDAEFLKDFFEREFDEDSFPDTFFVLTKNLPYGTLSARTDVRINRFVTDVERLPEIRYTLSNTEIGDSGFYFKNISTFSSLVKKNASPSEVRTSTLRGDTDYEVSYPTKIGFLEFKPFAGGQQTYYSRTTDPDDSELRNIYRAGATMSTRFFRTYDTRTNIWGLDINRLRHIITPQVLYEYTTEPDVVTAELNQFDSTDSRAQIHNINFQLENKLQTKRNDKTVELLRAIVGVDYRLSQDNRGGGFDRISTDVDFRPTDWLTLFFDSSYDTREDYLKSANFDVYINPASHWNFGLGRRYDRNVNDQVTAQLYYKFNPKWQFKVFGRYDIDEGKIKEQDYVLTRDLHSWEMDMKVNDTVGDGTEILFLFRLKAFPEIGGLDFGTTFERQRSGSENFN